MSTAAAEYAEVKATLRDLARKCQVRPLFASYYLVTTEAGHKYRVETWYIGGDYHAKCQCPVRNIRGERCRHELATIMRLRSELSDAQGF